MLGSPLLDLLGCMTNLELPLTAHEYGEWGDPSHPGSLQQASSLACHSCLLWWLLASLVLPGWLLLCQALCNS